MRHRRAFNLVELLIAVVVLGLIAALTIPRLGRAADTPDDTAILRERLKVLRVAIEQYYQDHGAYPAQLGDGAHPAGSEAAFIFQLTRFTDERGQASDAASDRYCFGPYLRDAIPACPVGLTAGSASVCILGGTAPPAFQPTAPTAGWVYNGHTGQIAANSDQYDSAGRAYNSY